MKEPCHGKAGEGPHSGQVVAEEASPVQCLFPEGKAFCMEQAVCEEG